MAEDNEKQTKKLLEEKIKEKFGLRKAATTKAFDVGIICRLCTLLISSLGKLSALILLLVVIIIYVAG